MDIICNTEKQQLPNEIIYTGKRWGVGAHNCRGTAGKRYKREREKEGEKDWGGGGGNEYERVAVARRGTAAITKLRRGRESHLEEALTNDEGNFYYFRCQRRGSISVATMCFTYFLTSRRGDVLV